MKLIKNKFQFVFLIKQTFEENNYARFEQFHKILDLLLRR